VQVDSDRRGLLTRAQTAAGLRALGVALPDAALNRVIALMDPAGSGREPLIDHHAFVSVLFPPDTHPRTKAFPFQRDRRRVHTRAAPVARPIWSAEPGYELMRAPEGHPEQGDWNAGGRRGSTIDDSVSVQGKK
jgi:hypothetical protein